VAKTKTSARPKAPRKSTKTASRKTKSSTKSRSAATRSAGDHEVTIDRRRPAKFRTDEKAGTKSPLAETGLERRQKVNRRRQIDPTTCERDYTDDEVEFMNAIEQYKRTSGRMFPTCSEVLEVLRSLGYVRRSAAEMVNDSVDNTATAVVVETTIDEDHAAFAGEWQ
jgi:hypothetical protein